MIRTLDDDRALIHIDRHLLGGLFDHPLMGGVLYYGQGDFLPQGVDNLSKGLRLIGVLDADIQWRSLVDQSMLPADLQRPL